MVRMAVDLAFRRDPALHRVELQVYAQNAPARAAYARAGFVLEGVLREDVPVCSAGRLEFWSSALMAVLRAEWESDQP
jgi:RimJ/RimL family protein N-acetyltransferase